MLIVGIDNSLAASNRSILLQLPKSKKGSQLAALPQSYFKFFFILSTASITFPRWPNADKRKILFHGVFAVEIVFQG